MPQVELADDHEAYDAALATIRSRPGMFAYACLVRVGRLWAVMRFKLQQANFAPGPAGQSLDQPVMKSQGRKPRADHG